MRKIVVGAALLYLLALFASVGYAATRFSEFYNPPAFSKFGAAKGIGADTLLVAYEQALGGEFGRYRRFLIASGLVVGVLLGASAALFGLWFRSVLAGVGAFAVGSLLTIAAFELMPAVWFPLDRYAVGFVWLLGGAPIAAAIWLAIMLGGRLARGCAFPQRGRV
jgi:hypothetical protein